MRHARSECGCCLATRSYFREWSSRGCPRRESAAELLLGRTGATDLGILLTFAEQTGPVRSTFIDFAEGIAMGTGHDGARLPPEVIAIGGVAGMTAPSDLDIICEHLRELCLYGPRVVPARFREDAVVAVASAQAPGAVEPRRFP